MENELLRGSQRDSIEVVDSVEAADISDSEYAFLSTLEGVKPSERSGLLAIMRSKVRELTGAVAALFAAAGVCLELFAQSEGCEFVEVVLSVVMAA